MKKMMMLILAILPLMSWAIDGNFLLKGKIGSGSPGAMIYLNYSQNGKMKTITASCVNGSFQFKGVLAEPKLAQLVMDPKGVGFGKLGKEADALVFFLENGTITVTSKGLLKNAVVTGSKINDENKKFRALLSPIEKEMGAILSGFYNAPENEQKSEQFKTETEAKLKKVGLKRRAMLNDYVKANPGSFLSLQTLVEALEQKEDPKKIKVLFNGLSSELRNSSSGKELQAKL